MRRLSFSWIIVMVALIFVIFVIAAKPGITGYSIFSKGSPDSQAGYNIPVYLYTFAVLIVLLIFAALVMISMNFHMGRTRLNEEDSIKELIKNIK